MNARKLRPTSPGEMLLEEFLKPMNITQYRLAQAIGVPQIRISQIIKGKRAITPDTALRFSRYFGNTPEFWINLQAGYDLKIARLKLEKKINKEIIPFELSAYHA